ncbi:hypoxanthine phosphoribosyltransferase [Vagococcus silagei]|uniref:Hypoxanthine phosphoribosyltransferase n=1 Tax=Vagococcus silagei TaxID=2508885 RepID=A0A4S3B1W7_9ENTE|nr:hypoxanthine phosphoribosyltransferase [Vagococcus silagei]THB60237.1 hypoxanthine phosphoribosyltransferase [Vagococcus silagei]
MLEKDIEKVFYSEAQIQERVKVLGQQISEDYQDKNPLVVGVLKGAVPFLADLVRAINVHLEMDFMDVSSYGSAFVSSGEVRILKDLDTVVEGRHIILVEDIIDSGRTLKYLVELLKHRKAASVKIVTMLDKPEGRVVDMEADYIGFDVPNEFVVGYGLDYIENYRNLPYIGVLKPAVYENAD